MNAIDEESVRQAAVKTREGSKTLGLDADGQRGTLITQNFGKSNLDCQKSNRKMIKKLCTGISDAKEISTLMASCLIHSDKNPGIRPTDVGEALKRIIGKVVVTKLDKEITNLVGALQFCAGNAGDCGRTIHAMRTVIGHEAVLSIDAADAFNYVNGNIFLRNIRIIFLSLSNYNYSFFSSPATLLVNSSLGYTEIKFSDRTT